MTDHDINRTDGATPALAGLTPGNDSSGQPDPGVSATDLKQKAKDDVSALRGVAEEKIADVSDEALAAADRQKGWAAERVAGVAGALEKVGRELEEGEQPEMGRMTRQMGETVHRFADDIKGRDLSEIAAMAEDFGRRQPLAFLGVAALAGLAASRLVTSSAARSPSMSSRMNSQPRSASEGVSPKSHDIAASAAKEPFNGQYNR